MSVEIPKIKSLLKDVKKIQKHQREIEKIKGETFNIFSILGVERMEDKTHSKFLAELLNPKGSHNMGSVFLYEFLKIIGCANYLDIKSAKVKDQHYISKIKALTGGTIDILIYDRERKYISIENKIYAPDQKYQLIRYSNFHKKSNKLFYLTLEGREASDISTVCNEPGQECLLECGSDYRTISYSKDILEWLQKCHQIAVDVPQLREAIKQYILLIKKLTNQMIDPKNLELKKALFDNAEAAQYVADNFYSIRNDIRENFRKDIYDILENNLNKDKFEILINNGVYKKQYAQIFIFLKDINDKTFFYSIETFSDVGNIDRDLYIGVIDTTGTKLNYKSEDLPRDLEEIWWKAIKIFKYNDEFINLSNAKFLKKLINPDSDLYKDIVSKVANESIQFINDHSDTIIEYFNQEKSKSI